MLKHLRQQLNSRIRYAIILPYLLLAAALLVLLGALTFWIIANNLQDQLDNTLQTSATNIGTAFEVEEGRILDDMRLVVSAPADPTAALSSTADAFAAGDQAQIQRIMDLTTQYYAPERVLAFAPDGTVLVDNATREIRDRSPSLVGTQTLANNPLVQAVLTGQSDTVGDKYTSLLQFGNDRPLTMLFVVAPVKAVIDGNETIVGAIAFARPLNDLLQNISVGGSQGSSTSSVLAILNSDGQILGSYPPDQTGLELTTAQINALRENRSLTTTADRGSLSFQLLYNPLRIRRALDGYFVVGLPRSAIANAWDESRAAVALVALLALLSVLAMGLSVTRRITRPLGELATTALQVKQGNLEQRSTVARSDELGTLASVLNEMTDRLLDLYRTSRQLGAELSIDGVLQQTGIALRHLYPDCNVSALVRQSNQWHHYNGHTSLSIDAPFSLQELETMPSVTDVLMVPTVASSIYRYERDARLVLPLRTQKQSIGALIIKMDHDPEELAAVMEPLSAVASMTATAINNALLYTTVQDEAVRKQAILQSIADGVIVLDAERNVLLSNTAAATMLGLKPDHVIGRAFADLPLISVQTSPDLFARESALQIYQVGKREFSLSAAPIINIEGRPSGEVLVLHDITAEREIDRAKTDFIATISHELRTPLTSICGYTDLILRGFAGPIAAEQNEFLTTIRQQAQSMSDFLQNVIVIASIEAGSMQPQSEPCAVHELVEFALATLRKPIEAKQLVLNIDVPDDLPLVMADRDHIKIALMQLLDNARRYTVEGSITISTTLTNQAVQIHIQDTGHGISPADQERLFTRFQRGGEQSGLATRERGAGLGLAITRLLIENLGGKIWVTSNVGEGSMFSVELPRATNEQLKATDHTNAMVTA